MNTADQLLPGVADVLAGRATWAVERGDCVEFLASLPADSVDLVVCSPPYTRARKYLEGGVDLGIARGADEWVAWMLSVCRQLSRVCRGLVAIVCEGKTKDYRYDCTPFLLVADLHREGFDLRKPAVYYRHGIPGKAGDGWSNKWEPVVLFSRPGKLPWSEPTATGRPPKYKVGGKPSFRLPDGTRIDERERRAGKHPPGVEVGGRRGGQDLLRQAEPTKDGAAHGRSYRQPARCIQGNVIRCTVGGGHLGPRSSHSNEAPFPESLVEPFVRCFCPPGGVVLDCFAGSGTTLAVAVAWGRRALGCDLRPSQVESTRKRLSLVTPTMFPSA